MVNPSHTGFLIALGMILMILSPVAIALYALLTATWGILGVVIASLGTYMVVNFYNLKDYNAKDAKEGKAHYRTLGLLLGPALIILGLYMIINY